MPGATTCWETIKITKVVDVETCWITGNFPQALPITDAASGFVGAAKCRPVEPFLKRGVSLLTISPIKLLDPLTLGIAGGLVFGKGEVRSSILRGSTMQPQRGR